MKVAAGRDKTHNPSGETCWVSRLRENFTSGSYGEGLETGRSLIPVPRQSFTRQLDFRNIKTTLGMEVLRCLTPQMVKKELWVNLLAYNLIRLLMAQAAAESGRQPRELSFKHTVQIWSQWTALHSATRHDWQRDILFKLIAQVRVGQRPGRLEPRARKRRPKSYPWLKVPRTVARQQIRELGYLPNA